MKMKLLVFVCLFALTIVGCGAKENDKTDTQAPSTEGNTETTEITETTEETATESENTEVESTETESTETAKPDTSTETPDNSGGTTSGNSGSNTPSTSGPTQADLQKALALTDAEKAAGYATTSFTRDGVTEYYKYKLETIGGKPALRYYELARDFGSIYIVPNPEAKFIIDFGKRVICTNIASESLTYSLQIPRNVEQVKFYWTFPMMQHSHYYQGATMTVLLPWHYNAEKGLIYLDANGPLISKADYLNLMSTYGAEAPSGFSHLSEDKIWTYDEMSIEFDVAYDLYVFHETYLKGTEYASAGLQYSGSITDEGYEVVSYQALKSGDLYNLFMSLKNQ